MDVCPLAKSGSELILDLINAENGSTITEDQIVFGEPTASTEDGNTGLNVAAAEDSPWNSFVDVKYDRLDLATLFGDQDVSVSVPKEATAADIICHLNFTYDLNFKVDEFDLLPQEDGAIPEPYKLRAKANNLAYTGEFPLFVDLERMPLSARILVTDLDGFGYPNSDIPSPNNPIQVQVPTRSSGSSYYAAFTKDYGDLQLKIELGMGGNTPPAIPVRVLDRTDGVRQMAWRYSNQGSSTASIEVTASKGGVALKTAAILDDYDISVIEIGTLGEGPEMKVILAEANGTGAPLRSDDGLTYPIRFNAAPTNNFAMRMLVDVGSSQPAVGTYARILRDTYGVGYGSATGGGSTWYYRRGQMIYRLKLKHRRNPNKPDFFIDFPVEFTL